VDRLLDAAAEVIAEVGVEAATTNAIAARAKTSVGSLYQFFPNKDALVRALAARYNGELRQINDQTMPVNPSYTSVEELVDRIMTPFAQFYMDNPAYRHVYHALHNPGGPSGEEDELHRVIVSRAELILASRAPQEVPEQRRMQATVAVLTAHALLGFAMTASPQTRDGIIVELKRALVAYIKDVTNVSPLVSRLLSTDPS